MNEGVGISDMTEYGREGPRPVTRREAAGLMVLVLVRLRWWCLVDALALPGPTRSRMPLRDASHGFSSFFIAPLVSSRPETVSAGGQPLPGGPLLI